MIRITWSNLLFFNNQWKQSFKHFIRFLMSIRFFSFHSFFWLRWFIFIIFSVCVFHCWFIFFFWFFSHYNHGVIFYWTKKNHLNWFWFIAKNTYQMNKIQTFVFGSYSNIFLAVIYAYVLIFMVRKKRKKKYSKLLNILYIPNIFKYCFFSHWFSRLSNFLVLFVLYKNLICKRIITPHEFNSINDDDDDDAEISIPFYFSSLFLVDFLFQFIFYTYIPINIQRMLKGKKNFLLHK